MNAFDQMKEAVKEARTQLRAADVVADELADLLAGRLRKVSSYNLARLKREIRDYNLNTKRWESRK